MSSSRQEIIKNLEAYTKICGISLSRNNNLYKTGIPIIDVKHGGLPSGLFEINGASQSGRTALALTIANTAMRKGYLPVYVDLPSKLTIERLASINIDPDEFPVVTARNYATSIDIISEGIASILIIDEIGMLGLDLPAFLKELSFAYSVNQKILILLVNQLRTDIKKHRKVPQKEGLMNRHIHGRLLIKRGESRYGGKLIDIILSRFYTTNYERRISLILKSGRIEPGINTLMMASHMDVATIIGKSINFKGKVYTIVNASQDQQLLFEITEACKEKAISKKPEARVDRKCVIAQALEGLMLEIPIPNTIIEIDRIQEIRNG